MTTTRTATAMSREYLYQAEVVRVVLVVGVMVSVLFYEKVQLTTGGAIVPAYLALALPAPLLVITTLVAGWLTWLVVHVWLPRRRILYGRRKFEVEMLVGLALIMIGTLIASRVGEWQPVLFGLTGIGYLVPGIICHDMGRQGPRKTVLAIAATTGIIAVLVMLLSGVLRLLDRNPDDTRLELTGALGYPRQLVILAAAASVVLGMLIYARLGLRSGGFITGAYLALVAPRWPDLLFAGACALVTWLIVVRGLMPRLLLFGRRKLATMIMVSGIVTWAAELLVRSASHDRYVPWRGLTIVTLMAPALIANDAQRQGWERTLWGVALCGTGVLASMNLIGAAATALGLLG